ncbi:hypothetical protein V8E51_001779 [Hyaloscypha variabilis]
MIITKVSHSPNPPAALLRPSGKTSVWPDVLKRINSLMEKSTSNNKADLAMKRSDPACWSGSVSSFNIDRSLSRNASNGGEMLVSMTREVQIQVERRKSIAASLSLQEQKSIADIAGSGRSGACDDARDPESKFWRDGEGDVVVVTGVDRGMGVHTKVWGP